MKGTATIASAADPAVRAKRTWNTQSGRASVKSSGSGKGVRRGWWKGPGLTPEIMWVGVPVVIAKIILKNQIQWGGRGKPDPPPTLPRGPAVEAKRTWNTQRIRVRVAGWGLGRSVRGGWWKGRPLSPAPCQQSERRESRSNTGGEGGLRGGGVIRPPPPSPPGGGGGWGSRCSVVYTCRSLPVTPCGQPKLREGWIYSKKLPLRLGWLAGRAWPPWRGEPNL